ncbi:MULTISPECIES: ABC transporter ATP-binding protein [unclassified Gordonia (in: high G+C Gram-positive bacteria)]|uniref:ABC transporter ATP-binding protein n=1 Tax=unclassified Gordonia (in: high G+C Gram-positive bacteria) TaxID=2657482 RepID=UPI001F063523|nr:MULTISPECIES: oligopeptide/dipeptide ABC transporter ATP-binding protein [unclassified Gordonia (in: high G+C Gram-positive bacteria)]
MPETTSLDKTPGLDKARRGAAAPLDTSRVLEVRDVGKTFAVSGKGGRKQLRALDGIDLDLRRGETLGLVGESGCGKSTLARTLMMLERPDTGTVRWDGTDPYRLKGKDLLALRRKVQMVFQDPYASLNNRMTAAEIIGEPWRTHKDLYPRKRDRAARVRELLHLVGLRPSDEHRSPQEFSGGQRQRLGIARALALDPEVIICDEPVSALDLSVQAQVLNLLNELQQELDISYIFISHDLSVVRHVADRVAVMYLGRIVETGSTEAVFDHPAHPYTEALMSAAPTLDADNRRERILLSGEVPSPLNPPSGCRFRTRCAHATDICATELPPAVTDRQEAGHIAECYHPRGRVGLGMPAPAA